MTVVNAVRYPAHRHRSLWWERNTEECTGMRFRILGPIEYHDGFGWRGIASAKLRALLAILLINAGHVISVDRIVGELWGEHPPATATNLVHGYVARLRAVLCDRRGDVLVTRSPGYVLVAGAAETDVDRFVESTEGGRDALAADDVELAVRRLAEGLALWRGAALADVPTSDLVAGETARLTELRLMAVEAWAAAGAERGRHQEVVARLGTLTREYPLRERLWASLIAALHAAGRRAEALAAYAEVRTLLADELGVDPCEELRRAHQAVLTDPPPAKPRRVPSQLPADLPPLIGRDEQLAAAGRLLATAQPWLAVTGPGGIGKTAFAMCLANRTRALFPDGVLVATCESTPVAGSVLARFLSAFGIPVNEAMLPPDPRARAAMLWDLLGDRRVLVVLDDVPDETHVRPLFPVKRGCGLVVTSRRRLAGLEAVHAVPLDVLPVDAGIMLLRATIGPHRVDDQSATLALVELCGGLPLAIKVVGARLITRPNWTVEDLARRLDDTRSRLDWLRLGDLGVRASIEASVSSLDRDQQELLHGLSLLEATEFAGWVAAALLDLPVGPAERLLDDLVEAHLVEPAGHGRTGPRYRMHDLIRLVASELTGEHDFAALGRVTHGWLALAAAADDRLAHWVGLDPEPTPRWLPTSDTLASVGDDPMRWFDEELEVLTRVVRQAAKIGERTTAWAIAQRLSNYLELRGRYDQWRDVLVAGLDAADEANDRQGQATMLGLLMQVEGTRDEHLSSLRYAALTVAAYKAVTTEPGQVPTGPPQSTSTLDSARAQGDTLAVGVEASRLTLALRLAGEQADYLSLIEEASDAFRVAGVPLLELWALKNVGLVYCRQHRFIDAEQCMRRAQKILRDHGTRLLAEMACGDLAGVAAAHGHVDLAEQLAAAALTPRTADGRRIERKPRAGHIG